MQISSTSGIQRQSIDLATTPRLWLVTLCDIERNQVQKQGRFYLSLIVSEDLSRSTLSATRESPLRNTSVSWNIIRSGSFSWEFHIAELISHHRQALGCGWLKSSSERMQTSWGFWTRDPKCYGWWRMTFIAS